MADFVKLTERAFAESFALRTSFLEGDISGVLENRRQFLRKRQGEIKQGFADASGVASGSGEQHGEAAET